MSPATATPLRVSECPEQLSDFDRSEWPISSECAADLRAMFRGAIRMSLELFLEGEFESLVGAEWYAWVGGRRDRRNGAYTQRLLTSLRQIEVTVPRSRESDSPSDALGRYQRRMDKINGFV